VNRVWHRASGYDFYSWEMEIGGRLGKQMPRRQIYLQVTAQEAEVF
jgi:hypothetical protein